MTALEIIFFCYPCLLLAIRILCEKLQLDMSIEILILILILIPINIYAAFQFKINKKKERVANKTTRFYLLIHQVRHIPHPLRVLTIHWNNLVQELQRQCD